jgi:virulence factor Mce-like protein
MAFNVTDRRQMQLVGLVAVIAVLIAGGIYLVVQPAGRLVVAYISSASAVFPDNGVRILGVPVGKITKVEPEGTKVRVEMRLDDPNLRLPADVKAAVISPSLVTGRYVQLTPPYTGGPQLENGGVIPIERTAVPLGVDELTRTATDLSRALGPNQLNNQGAVSDLLKAGAENLGGNGQALNDTIRNFGELSGTLADSRKDLFGTVTQLQSFVSTIAENDKQVREFNGRLKDVAGYLADERGDLAEAVKELGLALGDVADFVRDNRKILKSNVDRLNDVTDVLVKQKRALEEILDVAPAALGNLANTYNGSAGTLDTRPDLLRESLGATLCRSLSSAAPDQLAKLPAVGDLCGKLLSGIDLPKSPGVDGLLTSLQSGQLPPVPGLALPTEPDKKAEPKAKKESESSDKPEQGGDR